MRILHLTLKKKWFDMILSGVKKEEYREVKPYWISRFVGPDGATPLKFDLVVFKNGYSKSARSMTLLCEGITIGRGRYEWGAESPFKYFIIKLGERRL